MGNTSYSADSYAMYTRTAGTKTRAQIFTQNDCHQTMSPHGLEFREARDSEAHPNTVPVIIALDVTGSMGFIPEQMVKRDLGHIMQTLIDAGVDDATVCFLAIGDKYDLSPLQVGQFESGDQELVTWLERTWLEGHGGGGNHESYDLAWLFAAQHTITDAWEKRGQKGFLFTIGDERNWEEIEGTRLSEIMGYKQSQSYTPKRLLEMAQEKWNVMHIHVSDGNYAVDDVDKFWKPLLGQSFVWMPSKEIPKYITNAVVAGLQDTPSSEPSPDSFSSGGSPEPSEPKTEEEVL